MVIAMWTTVLKNCKARIWITSPHLMYSQFSPYLMHSSFASPMYMLHWSCRSSTWWKCKSYVYVALIWPFKHMMKVQVLCICCIDAVVQAHDESASYIPLKNTTLPLYEIKSANLLLILVICYLFSNYIIILCISRNSG